MPTPAPPSTFLSLLRTKEGTLLWNLAAFEAAAACKGKPTVLIAKTTKGKGVSFMENNAGWHGKAPNDEQYAQAKAEVEAKLAELEGK